METIRAAEHGQQQSFEFPGTFAADLNSGGLFQDPSVTTMAMPDVFSDHPLFNPGTTTWMDPNDSSIKRHRGPAKKASFARAKNDPERIFARQQAKNQTIEWLLTELKSRPGYREFSDALNSTQHNMGAVRSWTFAVEFRRAYNKVQLVVSEIVTSG